MAEKLLKYYKFVADKGGITAKVELAKLTHIPTTRAALEPDSAENIAKFKDAVKKITGSAPDF